MSHPHRKLNDRSIRNLTAGTTLTEVGCICKLTRAAPEAGSCGRSFTANAAGWV